VILLDIARPSGLHRAVDEVLRLRYLLDKAKAGNTELRRRLLEATTARDAANAKASQLGDAELRAAEATQRADNLEREVTALRSQLANSRKVGDLPAHPAVTETQRIPVFTLPEANERGHLQ
jgi:multidrug efflux pump subunit AcrA (membrane-fusion protein)